MPTTLGGIGDDLNVDDDRWQAFVMQVETVDMEGVRQIGVR